jgi:hypothetical protein
MEREQWVQPPPDNEHARRYSPDLRWYNSRGGPYPEYFLICTLCAAVIADVTRHYTEMHAGLLSLKVAEDGTPRPSYGFPQ